MKDLVKLLNEIWAFMGIELRSFRLIGFGTTAVVLGIPFGVMLIIFLLTGGSQSWGILYAGGGITLIISNLCLVTLSQRLVGLRERGGIEFYNSLPVSQISIQFGILLVYLIVVIPMIFIFLFVCVVVFNLRFAISGWLPLIILLSILSFMGIGGIIGLYPRNYQRAHNLSTILMFFVMFGTPIFWPAEVLPKFVQTVQRFFPFIYSVEGVRICLGSTKDGGLIYYDILALAIFSALSLFLTLRLNLFQER